MVEGPGEVYVCHNCVELCQNIFKQERRRVSSISAQLSEIPSPREIVEFMDQYVIGQQIAKRSLSVAVHNHYKRLMHHESEHADNIELDKSNILLIRPVRARLCLPRPWRGCSRCRLRSAMQPH